MSTHTAGPMEAARAAWVRIGRAKPNGDVDIFRKADAEMRLIASAPDLLAALQDVELRCTQAKIASTIGKRKDRTDFLRGELERIAEQASAAIRKATGAQS